MEVTGVYGARVYHVVSLGLKTGGSHVPTTVTAPSQIVPSGLGLMGKPTAPGVTAGGVTGGVTMASKKYTYKELEDLIVKV